MEVTFRTGDSVQTRDGRVWRLMRFETKGSSVWAHLARANGSWCVRVKSLKHAVNE